MRVLWITERFPPDKGGAAVSAGRQVGALAPHVGRLDVLRLAEGLEPGQVRVTGALHEVGRAPTADESLQLLLQAAQNLHAAQRYALVHGFYAVHAGQVAVAFAREAGLASVVSLRGNDVDRAMFSSSRFAPLLWTLQNASALVGVSRAILDRARMLVGREQGLHLIANGVDTGVFRPVAAAELAFERPRFAFAGELRLKKGLPVLQALAERLAVEGRGSVVAIGGARGEEADALQRWRAARPAASARLVEVPYVKDPQNLAALYCAMDLFVFPSLWEGLPNAALEAMACGRPVLAAAVGGFPDLITQGENGWLMPPHEIDRFAAEAWRIATAPDTVGAAGRERVRQSFGVDAERDAHLALWRSLAP